MGGVTAPIAGSSHVPRYLASIDGTRSADGVMSKPPGSPRSSSTGRASCSRLTHPQRGGGGDQLEIGHAAAEQRVPLAEVVTNAQAGHLRGDASESGKKRAHFLRFLIRRVAELCRTHHPPRLRRLSRTGHLARRKRLPRAVELVHDTLSHDEADTFQHGDIIQRLVTTAMISASFPGSMVPIR